MKTKLLLLFLSFPSCLAQSSCREKRAALVWKSGAFIDGHWDPPDIRAEMNHVFPSSWDEFQMKNDGYPDFDTLSSYDLVYVEGGAKEWDYTYGVRHWLLDGGVDILEQLAHVGTSVLVMASGGYHSDWSYNIDMPFDSMWCRRMYQVGGFTRYRINHGRLTDPSSNPLKLSDLGVADNYYGSDLAGAWYDVESANYEVLMEEDNDSAPRPIVVANRDYPLMLSGLTSASSWYPKNEDGTWEGGMHTGVNLKYSMFEYLCGAGRNFNPTIQYVLGMPKEPVPLNSATVDIVVTCDDENNNDVLELEVSWGDDSTNTAAGVPADTCQASLSHTYIEPGVYTLAFVARDNQGGVSEVLEHDKFVVAFDPDGGFVTGGGWIDSPQGAYTADPLLTGKASFGFVSKYKKGAHVPTGETEFKFHVAGLNFHSDDYDWLVVAGKTANFKGQGSINGQSLYEGNPIKFRLWVRANDPDDTFRIKIFAEDESIEEILYDNKVPACNSDEFGCTVIESGSIKVHKGKRRL